MYPMPQEWNDPNPAGWALNVPKSEGKMTFHISSMKDYGWETEMLLKPSGRYSAQGIKWMSVDEEELMRFKEEKDRKKGKVGSDRMKKFDDVYSS